MPSPVVSQELVDTIITQLEGDVRTLLRCCLVSRSFLSTSRRMLFSTVDLRYSPECISVCESICLALRHSPDLVQCVKTVVFRLDWHPRLNTTIITDTLKMFSHLQNFVLRSDTDHDWMMRDDYLRLPLLNVLNQPTLRSVSVRGVRGFPLSTLTRCHQLKSIAIEGDIVISTGGQDAVFDEERLSPTHAWGRLESLSGPW
jgi:hypothetical protein